MPKNRVRLLFSNAPYSNLTQGWAWCVKREAMKRSEVA